MPTGYTAKIKDGISFEEYAMNCAREFGACVTMRDDPSDKEIPVFEPSDYHSKALKEAEDDLFLIQCMSESEVYAKNKEEWSKSEESRKKRLQETIDLRKKYESMLCKCENWVPPTPEHNGLHEFMIKQIRDSIEFD